MIQLNYRDPRPIYEQVKDGIRKLAYSGVIGPDEKLPSVRELASKLAINPNTISRAYKELEQEGFIYTLTGKGTFINQGFDLNDRRKEELYQKFDKVVKELLEISISSAELKARIDRMSNDDKKIVDSSEQADRTENSDHKDSGSQRDELEKGGSIDDSSK